MGELPFFGDSDDLLLNFFMLNFAFSGEADAGGFALIFELAGAILSEILIVLILR